MRVRRVLEAASLWLLPSAVVALPMVEGQGTLAWVILGLAGLALWWMGHAIRNATGAVLPALLAQTAPLLSNPTPEPLPLIAAALLTGALMPLLPPHDEAGRWDRAAALAGIAVALGVAGEARFAVLGVVPLLLFDRRRLLIYAGVAAVALGLALGVAAGAQSPPPALLSLFAATLVFWAGLGLLVLYFRLRRRGLMRQDRFARLLAGSIAAQGLVVLMAARLPAAHSLIPALLLTGPALAAAWSLSRPLLAPRRHARLWAGVLAVLVLVQAPQMVAPGDGCRVVTTPHP